jgi:phosphotransferase system enzyme I (PtsP)
MQYLFAADRNNTHVAGRYDALSAAPLKALAAIANAARRHNRPFGLCGEMASRPLEAMALIGLGFRYISMAPASVGPVKSMILSLDAAALERWLQASIQTVEGSLRAGLKRFAEEHGVEI